MMIPIEAIKSAQRGFSVLVVVDCIHTLSTEIEAGSLHIRNFRLSALRSVAVDIVYLIGDIPIGVEEVARERCRGSFVGEVIKLP